MASLKDNLAIVARGEIAKRAEVEGAVLARRGAAGAGRLAMVKALDGHRETPAALEAKPVETLPDDDASLRDHFLAIEVAKSRIKIGEKKIGDADATSATAQAEVEADRAGPGAAFDQAARARARLADDFDVAYLDGCAALFETIKTALTIEARARAFDKKGANGRPAAADPEFAAGKPNSVTMRISMVDSAGVVLWRGDQFTTAAQDQSET